MKSVLRLVLLLGLFGTPLTAAAASGPATAPSAPGSALQTDHFAVDVGGIVFPQDAQVMRAAGVQLARYSLLWATVQPTNGAAYDWRVIDNSLRALAAEQIDVMIILAGNPSWAASSANSGPDGPVDLVSPEVYYNFVQAAVQRYSTTAYTVRGWEIYNEVDRVSAWGHRAAGYVQVLQRDSTIIKSVMPNAFVVMAGLGYDNFTDQCLPNGQCGPFVRSFLADFLTAGGAAYTDAINFHHYNNSAWPNLDAVVQSIRTTMQAAGAQNPLIWTETGAPSAAGPPYNGGEQMQAAYVVEAYAKALSLGISTVAWFPLHDFTSAEYWYFQYHGLVKADYTPKPALASYTAAARYLGTATALRALRPDEFTGPNPAEGYSFAVADGTGLLVAWSTGQSNLTLPARVVTDARDMYDNQRPYTVSGGQATIALDPAPVYIKLRTPARFGDVSFNDYFYTPVEYLVTHGAVSGYSDGTYRPGSNATRGQISKMVSLAMGWPVDNNAPQVFADVLPGSTFYGVIGAAYAHGIISGYDCGQAAGEPCDAQHRPYFRPANNVTRGQLSKMLVRAKGWAEVPPTSGIQSFTDVPPTYPFYGVIEAAVAHGVVSGYSDRTFRPGNQATRGQLAKMIYVAVTQP